MENFLTFVITGLAGATLGAICVFPFESAGPRAQRIGAFVSAPVSAILMVASMIIAASPEVSHFASLSAFICSLTAFGIMHATRKSIEKVVNLAPVVAKVVDENFGGFDADDDHVISAVDLDRILCGEVALPAGVDRKLVEHVRENILMIGHEVGTYTTSSGKTTTTHHVAVISPRDLKAYPTKVAAQYPNWMPQTAGSSTSNLL